MKKALITSALALALVAPAEAATRYDTVPCAGPRGTVIKVKPRNCTLASGAYGYQQAGIRNIRWRSWGGKTAYGRGTMLENMGARLPVRFKLYGPRYYEHGSYVYLRARGTTFGSLGPIRWRIKIRVVSY